MTITFEFVPADQPERWDSALGNLPHGYWHGWHACHAISIESEFPVRLCVARDGHGVIAAAPVGEREWEGERDLFTPVGFSGFAAARPLPVDFSSRWSEFAAAHGYVAGYFALHPLFGEPAAHSGLSSDNELFVLDLSDGPDEFLRRCDRSVRRAAKASEVAGLRFVDCRQALTAFVLENYTPCLTALGARVLWPPATLAEMCADPDLLMVGVEDAAGICAVHTFGVAGRSADFHLHLSVREGRRHTAAMICQGLRRLLSVGVARVNLGGGIVRGDSVAQSKLKFHPQSVPFLRARELYRPQKFRELCERAGVDPGASRFHPAYQSPPPFISRATEPVLDGRQ